MPDCLPALRTRRASSRVQDRQEARRHKQQYQAGESGEEITCLIGTIGAVVLTMATLRRCFSICFSFRTNTILSTNTNPMQLPFIAQQKKTNSCDSKQRRNTTSQRNHKALRGINRASQPNMTSSRRSLRTCKLWGCNAIELCSRSQYLMAVLRTHKLSFASQSQCLTASLAGHKSRLTAEHDSLAAKSADVQTLRLQCNWALQPITTPDGKSADAQIELCKPITMPHGTPCGAQIAPHSRSQQPHSGVCGRTNPKDMMQLSFAADHNAWWQVCGCTNWALQADHNASRRTNPRAWSNCASQPIITASQQSMRTCKPEGVNPIATDNRLQWSQKTIVTTCETMMTNVKWHSNVDHCLIVSNQRWMTRQLCFRQFWNLFSTCEFLVHATGCDPENPIQRNLWPKQTRNNWMLFLDQWPVANKFVKNLINLTTDSKGRKFFVLQNFNHQCSPENSKLPIRVSDESVHETTECKCLHQNWWNPRSGSHQLLLEIPPDINRSRQRNHVGFHFNNVCRITWSANCRAPSHLTHHMGHRAIQTNPFRFQLPIHGGWHWHKKINQQQSTK